MTFSESHAIGGNYTIGPITVINFISVVVVKNMNFSKFYVQRKKIFWHVPKKCLTTFENVWFRLTCYFPLKRRTFFLQYERKQYYLLVLKISHSLKCPNKSFWRCPNCPCKQIKLQNPITFPSNVGFGKKLFSNWGISNAHLR